MHHVFVSYSRSDGPWVRSLVAALKERGLTIWLDQADIPATVPWMREVQDAIDEAQLVLCCDSPDFRTSTNCAIEVRLAVQASKPRYVVTVGADPRQAAAGVQHSVKSIEPLRFRRTELRVLARDWDRAGRPRGKLVRRRLRRRLEAGLTLPPPSNDVERRFLRASRTRSLRRTTVSILATTVLSLLFGILRVYPTLLDKLNTQLDNQATAYSIERTGLDYVDQDPYLGLAYAAKLGGDRAAVHASVISAALRYPTPDDAFTVGGAARRFVLRPVGTDVVVADAAGHQWHRGAADTATRRASRLSRPLPAASGPAPAGLTVHPSGTGVVDILRSGRRWRAVTFDDPPAALALSPDGRLLAGAVGAGAEIIDVATGQIRERLRGAAGTVHDLAWSTRGTRLWGLTDDTAVTWPVDEGTTTLLDHPGEAYTAVLPAADPGHVWVAATHSLLEIDAKTGQVVDTRPVADTIRSAGGAPDGSVAVVSGAAHLWVMPLTGTEPARSLDIAGCSYGRATLPDATTAYLTCLGTNLETVSLRTARVVADRNLSPSGLFGSHAVPGSDLVFLGDTDGHVLVVRGRGDRATDLFSSECGAEITRIAVAPGARALLPVGVGTGLGTCTRVGLRGSDSATDESAWTWNAVEEQPHVSMTATSAAFSADGAAFAVGYNDGTVTLHPTDDLLPTLSIDVPVGAVRDMLALADGSVVAVTDLGMALRLPVCPACLNDTALAMVAANRLDTAIRLGLAPESIRNLPAPAPLPSAGG